MTIPITNIASLQFNLSNQKLSEFIDDQIFSALSVIRIELENLEKEVQKSKKDDYPNLSFILDWQQHSSLDRNYNAFQVSESIIEFISIFDDINNFGSIKICDGTFNSFLDELNSFTLEKFNFTICKDENDEDSLVNSIISRVYKRKLIFTEGEKRRKIAREKGEVIKSIMGRNNPIPDNMDFTIEEIWIENTPGTGGEPPVVNWNIKMKSFQINTPVGFKGKSIPNRKIL